MTPIQADRYTADDTPMQLALEHHVFGWTGYIPHQTNIVIGRNARIEQEVYANEVQRSRVAILRRLTGGGTVVINQGQVVLARTLLAQTRDVHTYVDKAIGELLTALRAIGIHEVERQGFSDLAIHGQKVSGSGALMSRNIFLFDCTLLVDPPLDVIDRLLPQPTTQPSYRANRGHREFLGSLRTIVPDITPKRLLDDLMNALPQTRWPHE